MLLEICDSDTQRLTAILVSTSSAPATNDSAGSASEEGSRHRPQEILLAWRCQYSAASLRLDSESLTSAQLIGEAYAATVSLLDDCRRHLRSLPAYRVLRALPACCCQRFFMPASFMGKKEISPLHVSICEDARGILAS